MEKPLTQVAAGDHVLVLFNEGRDATYAVWCRVEKVGRKWVTIRRGDFADYRFRIGEAHLDGGNYHSPGRVFATKEEAVQMLKHNHLVQRLNRWLPRMLFKMSLSQLETMSSWFWPNEEPKGFDMPNPPEC